MTSTAKFIALCVCLLAATSLAHAAPSSRLAYAQQCAAEMGAIPSFNCMSGAIIPITKNGLPLTQPTPGEDCDNPIQLGIGASQCVPFARFLRIPTGNPDVETAVICRKYSASSGPNDATFRDIAVIQHHKGNGNTCFFQSRLSGPLHDGSMVPSPQATSPAANNFWLEPSSGGPGGIPCTICHDADPFIWSPYIVQVANPSNWNPLGPWHSNYQDLFGQPVTTFKPDNNACTACHRIGSEICQPSNSGIGHVSVQEVADKRWMPPGFSGSAAQWQQSYGAAMAQIAKCCANPGEAECKSMIADGGAAAGGWGSANLTAVGGGAPAAGDPIAYVTDFPGQGPTARLVYRAGNGSVYELFYVAP